MALICINERLVMRGDYSECMRRLMKFPPVGDVSFIVEQALHIRDPKVLAKRLSHVETHHHNSTFRHRWQVGKRPLRTLSLCPCRAACPWT